MKKKFLVPKGLFDLAEKGMVRTNSKNMKACKFRWRRIVLSRKLLTHGKKLLNVASILWSRIGFLWSTHYHSRTFRRIDQTNSDSLLALGIGACMWFITMEQNSLTCNFHHKINAHSQRGRGAKLEEVFWGAVPTCFHNEVSDEIGRMNSATWGCFFLKLMIRSGLFFTPLWGFE